MAASPDNIFSLFNDADLTFDDAVDSEGAPRPVTHGTFVPLLMSSDRVLRESAFKSLYARYGRFRNTCAAVLAAQAKQLKFFADARSYPSALAASLRESAFKSLYARYGRFRNTCAAVLAAQAKQLKFFADARSYPSALAASLDETEVPIEVYGNLIDTVHRNMDPMHRYVELRRDLLGVDELHFWDLHVPLFSDIDMKFTYEEACDLMLEALAPLGEELRRDLLGVDELHFWDLHVPLFSDIDMKFTYEEACDLMLEALAPLGEDYLAIVRRAVGERWIDVYENPGKRSGAYSARSFGTHPVTSASVGSTSTRTRGSARALTPRVRSARIRSCCSTSRERSTMCSRSCTKWGIRCTRTCPRRRSLRAMRITSSSSRRWRRRATRRFSCIIS